jgi:hypothetical protein
VWIGGAVFMGIGALIGLLLMGSTLLTMITNAGVGRQPTTGQVHTVGAGVVVLGITAVIFGLCSLAELILRVIGYGMCMAAPSTRGSSHKPLAVTAFSLAAAEAAFRLFGCAWGAVGGASVGAGGLGLVPVGGNIMSGLAGLLGLAAFIVFLFFGRSVAGRVKDRGLGSSLLTVLIVFAVYHVLEWVASFALAFGLFASIFSAASSRTASGVAATIGTFGVIVMILGGIMFITYLGMEVWYIFVLQRLRDGVQRRLAK